MSFILGFPGQLGREVNPWSECRDEGVLLPNGAEAELAEELNTLYSNFKAFDFILFFVSPTFYHFGILSA